MHVIAVAQLDRLIKKLDKLDSEEVTQVLLRQVHLLEQCHAVREWLFMAEPESISRLSAEFHTEAPGRLVGTLRGDPLDEFYHATSNHGTEYLADAGRPLVLRIVPGLQDPEPTSVDAIIMHHIQNGYDYSRTDQVDDGIAPYIEVMSYAVLDEAWREALLPDDREQISPYIYRQNRRLSLGTFSPSKLTGSGVPIPPYNSTGSSTFTA